MSQMKKKQHKIIKNTTQNIFFLLRKNLEIVFTPGWWKILSYLGQKSVKNLIEFFLRS